jgi:outer membrane protein assembly factor BamD
MRVALPVFRLKAVCVVCLSLLLTGCTTSGTLNEMMSGKNISFGRLGGALSPGLGGAAGSDPVANLYNQGLYNLNGGSYISAAKNFAEVERQHPYSKWATKALLLQAFAFYQNNSYEDAVNSGNRFISLHPGHKDVPYAYYIVALSNYEQINDVRRDQRQTQKALDAMEEVSKRFPDSPYAADAQKKALLAKDHLAAKEMEIGRYYLGKGSYLAGINRFKRVVTEYQTTSHTPEALYRIAEGYMALGITSEAQTAAAVLGHNFPTSRWYKDAYTLVSSDGRAPVENQSSWISRAFDAVTPG